MKAKYINFMIKNKLFFIQKLEINYKCGAFGSTCDFVILYFLNWYFQVQNSLFLLAYVMHPSTFHRYIFRHSLVSNRTWKLDSYYLYLDHRNAFSGHFKKAKLNVNLQLVQFFKIGLSCRDLKLVCCHTRILEYVGC